MVKRLLTLMLALALILSVSAAFTQDGAANAASSTTSSGETADSMIMYVYTDNGQGLNVRRSPFVGNNIIGLAPYGSEVHVIRFLNNGWACIEWDNYTEAYVQSRFLQWYKPGTNVTPTAPAAPTAPNTVPTAPNNTPGCADLCAADQCANGYSDR